MPTNNTEEYNRRASKDDHVHLPRCGRALSAYVAKPLLEAALRRACGTRPSAVRLRRGATSFGESSQACRWSLGCRSPRSPTNCLLHTRHQGSKRQPCNPAPSTAPRRPSALDLRAIRLHAGLHPLAVTTETGAARAALEIVAHDVNVVAPHQHRGSPSMRYRVGRAEPIALAFSRMTKRCRSPNPPAAADRRHQSLTDEPWEPGDHRAGLPCHRANASAHSGRTQVRVTNDAGGCIASFAAASSRKRSG